MRPQRTPAKRTRRARCDTGKRRFPDKEAAASALRSAQSFARQGDANSRECRVYACGKCHGWHLTSQPGR